MQRTARDCWIMTSTHNDTSSEGLYVIQGFRFQTVAAQPATRALQDCNCNRPSPPVFETCHGGERGRWPSLWRRRFGRLIPWPDGGGAQGRLLLRGSRSSWRRLAGLAASGPRRRSGGCGRSSYSSTPRPTSPSPKVT